MSSLDQVMSILRSALFDEPYSAGNGNENDLLNELDSQAVLSLIQPILKSVNLTDKQYEERKRKILQCVANNSRVARAEKEVSELFEKNNMPNVILKGTSYAQYYPNPVLRMRGDVDVLVDENDFEAASALLVSNGYVCACDPKRDKRHIEYFKNGLEVELHHYFSFDDKQSVFFNVTKLDRIYDGLPCFRPAENGMSMLLHLKYHLGKIGLRHYIDWLMYVQKVCDDAFWNTQFQRFADQFQVTDLAKALTKAGKRYFPLQEITWCDDVEDALCDDLLNELFESGNFSAHTMRKKMVFISNSSKNLFFWLKVLSRRGVKNWEPAQKHKILVPVAFFRQAYLYVKRYFQEDGFNLKILKQFGKKRSSVNKNK